MKAWSSRLWEGRVLPVLGAITVSVLLACGSTATSQPASTPQSLEAAQGQIKPILATTVLRVGPQRIAFLLSSSEALIKSPHATISSEFLGDGQATTETKRALFHLWPYGVRGSYSAQVTFDRSGPWQLNISVDGPDGPATTELLVEVAESVDIPEIGAVPPFSPSKTLSTVERLEQLTSDYTPDPDLYRLSITEAIISGRPTVIVFATPAFCTSPTCGPQVDTVSQLKEGHLGEANFIHVEYYDNPEGIQGDLSKATLVNLVQEWGFSAIPDWFNESWTFVLGSNGRIAQRFEGFASLEELEESLQAVLSES